MWQAALSIHILAVTLSTWARRSQWGSRMGSSVKSRCKRALDTRLWDSTFKSHLIVFLSAAGTANSRLVAGSLSNPTLGSAALAGSLSMAKCSSVYSHRLRLGVAVHRRKEHLAKQMGTILTGSQMFPWFSKTSTCVLRLIFSSPSFHFIKSHWSIKLFGTSWQLCEV